VNREGATVILVVVTLVVLALIAWGWRRRTRRDAGIAAPVGELPADAAIVAVHEGLYVASTEHDAPLERLAIRRLAFRSKATVTVARGGVALDLTGQPRMVLAADRIVAADQATVTIDRVVEKDGLIRIVWRADGATQETIVDTYLRAQDASARAVVDEIRSILPAAGGSSPAASPQPPVPTGSDA